MKVKITVKTPRNQAHKCIKTQRKAIIGVGHKHKVIEEKVVSHNKFYWIIEPDNEKDLNKIIKKAAAGEVIIKKFYSALFHIIGKANKLAEKFDKGAAWIRRFIVKRLRKSAKFAGDDDKDNLINKVENMTDEQLKDFIKIHDKEEMQKLLSGQLITVKEL